MERIQASGRGKSSSPRMVSSSNSNSNSSDISHFNPDHRRHAIIINSATTTTAMNIGVIFNRTRIGRLKANKQTNKQTK
jgi:hypothetical protein